MNKRQRPSSSSLFLMELILAILLFCIAATICVSVFARSNLMHKESVELNRGLNVTQNMAELILSDTNLENIAQNISLQYPISDISQSFDEPTYVYLDSDFTETVESDSSAYTMVLTPSIDDGMLSADIEIKKSDSSTLCNLHIDHAIY